MFFNRLEKIFVFRSPSRLFWRVQIRKAVEIVKALRESHFGNIIPSRRASVPKINFITEFRKRRSHRGNINLFVSSFLIIYRRVQVGKSRNKSGNCRRSKITDRHEISAVITIRLFNQRFYPVRNVKVVIFSEHRPLHPTFTENYKNMSRRFNFCSLCSSFKIH